MVHMATAERAHDVGGMSPEAAAAEVLDRFDALYPGERFVLVGGDAGVETLRRLQTERPGAFEWSPLAVGPPIWRTEIEKRDSHRPNARGVQEALSWDHARLDALEAAAFGARSQGDLPEAFDLYAEFSLGLRRHIGFEEDLLFPAFELGTGMPPAAGPTAVMRMEHREIERLLESIAAGIGDAAAEVDALRARLHVVLDNHNVKEERVLYPTIDQMLGAKDAQRLVARIQRYGS
jgi:uncharacterized protein (DUF2249 family)/hemerythrin-like domain-containing protein